jgi:large subunit ribosomal protein L10
MNKEQKAATVDEIAEQIGAAEAVFAVDYRGISVPGAAELRGKLREADASFRIVKNSLTERAADKAGADSLRALLDGPTALTFVRGDAALAAKAIADFRRAHDVLEFKGGTMNGEELTVDEIKTIARLPAREVLYAQLVGTVGSPLTGLVRGLGSMISGFASQLQQIVDGGMLAPGEPAAEEEAPAAEAQEPAAEAEEAAPAEEEPAAEAEEAAPAEEEPAAEAEETTPAEPEEPAAEAEETTPAEPEEPAAEAEEPPAEAEETTPAEPEEPAAEAEEPPAEAEEAPAEDEPAPEPEAQPETETENEAPADADAPKEEA